MKRIIFILFISFLPLHFASAKELPEFVRQRLDSIRIKAKISLRDYRVWDFKTNGYKTLPCRLSFREFSDEEISLIDSLELKISIEMIYDNGMRNRIVQLLRNEYQEWELDSLTNKLMKAVAINYEREARRNCRFDTLQAFRTALDSIYINVINSNPQDSAQLRKYEHVGKYQYEHEVFKLLRFDTTTVFKIAYNNILNRERKKIRQDYLTQSSDKYIYIAELCGYIGDKRFIKPLVGLLGRVTEEEHQMVESWGGTKEHEKETIVEALVRLRAEPYYSDYVKFRTRTIEQIKSDRPDFRIDDFIDVLGTQWGFRELSKYLLSDVAYIWESRDNFETGESTDVSYPIYSETLRLVRHNIRNKDLQQIFNAYEYWWEHEEELRIPVYDWMQKNYGKYQIKREW